MTSLPPSLPPARTLSVAHSLADALRHKYKTRAIWYDGRFCFGSFTRSLEGSAAVFVTAALTVVAYYAFGYFSSAQFVAAMLIMPVGFTATEAYAPHTWDNPCLVAAGFFFTWVCLDVVK